MKKLALYIKKNSFSYNVIVTVLVAIGLFMCAIFPDNNIMGFTGLVLFGIGFITWLVGIVIVITFLDINELQDINSVNKDIK